jgi:hypothetical protein
MLRRPKHSKIEVVAPKEEDMARRPRKKITQHKPLEKTIFNDY